ncbi:Tuberous sclerosis 2-like protein [Batrachochytrium dendrobatidis]|nr:Tuberous sclerosis 2-like protein [Batrachochytrium dendrobatidis]
MTGTLERLKTTFSRKGSLASDTNTTEQLLSTDSLSLETSTGPARASNLALKHTAPHLDLASILACLDNTHSTPQTITTNLQKETALVQLQQYICTFDVASMLSEIWNKVHPCLAIKPLMMPAMQVMVAMLETHFEACDLLRLSFFNAIAEIEPFAPISTDPASIDPRLTILCVLTKDGRDLRHIEHELGPLLLASAQTLECGISALNKLGNTSDSPLLTPDFVQLDKLLVFISKVIKFSSIHLRSDILAQLLTHITRLIQVPIVNVPTKIQCLNCLDALVRYGSIPLVFMRPMIKSLCFAAQHPDLDEQAWAIFNNVQHSHHSAGATAELFEAMQLSPQSSSLGDDHDDTVWITIVLGSISLFQRLFENAMALTSTTTTPAFLDSLFPNSFILSHLAFPLKHQLTILASHALLAIVLFLNIQQSHFSVLEWEILVDIHAASGFIWTSHSLSDTTPDDSAPISTLRQLHSQLEDRLQFVFFSKLSLFAQSTLIRSLIAQSSQLSSEKCLFLLEQIPLTLKYLLDLPEYAVTIIRLMDTLYFPKQPPPSISDESWPEIRTKTFSLFVKLYGTWSIQEDEDSVFYQHVNLLVDRILVNFCTDTMLDVVRPVAEWILELCVDADLCELEQLMDTFLRRIANITASPESRVSDLFMETQSKYQSTVGSILDLAQSSFKPAGLDSTSSVHGMYSLISLFHLIVQRPGQQLPENAPTIVFRWIVNLSKWDKVVPESSRLVACRFLGSFRADDHYGISYSLLLDMDKHVDDCADSTKRVHSQRLYASAIAVTLVTDDTPASTSRPVLSTNTSMPSFLISPATATTAGTAAASTNTISPTSSLPSGTAHTDTFNFSHMLRHDVLPIGEYLEAVMTIFKLETQYSILHETLVNITLQIQNHLLWQDAHLQMRQLRALLCDIIITERVAVSISAIPQEIRKADIYLSFFKLLVLLFGFRFLFTKLQQDELVSVFQLTLNRWPTNAKFCIQALSLALFEMPMSITKHLPSILMKISQTTSQALSIPNLEFLSALARVPELYINFTEADYRRVFGVSIQYIRLFNSNLGSGDSSVSSYITELAFHVMSLWFMSLKLGERRKFVPFIIHNLVATSNMPQSATSAGLLATTGQAAGMGPAPLQLNEHVELVLEMMAQNTYVDCWPKPNNAASNRMTTASLTGNKLATRSWIQGNALLSIVVAKETGWTELIVRRPSGVVSLWIHLDNATQKINSSGQSDWLAQTFSLSPLVTLPSLEMVTNPIATNARLEYAHSRSASTGSTKGTSITPLTMPKMDPKWLLNESDTASEQPLDINNDVTPLSRIRRTRSISIARKTLSTSRMTSSPLFELPTVAPIDSATASVSMREEQQPIEPGFIPMLFFPYPSNQVSQDALRPLPDTDAINRAIAVLDRTPVIELHKIGIVYVAPGQSTEVEILSNTYGSRTYTYFLHLLGRLFRLAGCRDVYVGGLDISSDTLDGEFGLCSADDQRLAQVIYHVTTLMPNRDYDPTCTGKKRHIGNDFVSIVWNEGGIYKQDTIPGQFNYFYVVVEPLSLSFSENAIAPGAYFSNETLFTSVLSSDRRQGRHSKNTGNTGGSISTEGQSQTTTPITSPIPDSRHDPIQGAGLRDSIGNFTDVANTNQDNSHRTGMSKFYTSLFRVSILIRSDLPDPGQVAQVPKIVTGGSLAAYVRQLAVHANMFSQIYAQKEHSTGYASNARERLRQVKRIRERLDGSGSAVKGDSPLPPSTLTTLQDSLDFTKYMQ